MKNIILSAVIALLFSGCNERYTQLENQNMRQITIIKQQKQKLQSLKEEIKAYQEREKSFKDKNATSQKLKKVEDTNYSSNYMYPQTNKKSIQKPKTVLSSSSMQMTKEECISMITQTRFDKYTKLFGSEEASIERCKMLKAMR